MSKQSIKRELTSLITNKYFRVSKKIQKLKYSPWKWHFQILWGKHIFKNAILFTILLQISTVQDVFWHDFLM